MFFLHSMSLEHRTGVSFRDTSVNVAANGLINSNAIHRFSTTCNVNLRQFPFDNQTCLITFNFGMSNEYLALKDGGVDGVGIEDIFDENNEWNNVEMTHWVDHGPYYRMNSDHANSAVKQTDFFTIKIIMDRNPVFYVIYLLIPSVLMAFVSVLVFLLPPDSGERVGLSITVLLSYTVFLLMVSEFTPRGGSNTAILGKSAIN